MQIYEYTHELDENPAHIFFHGKSAGEQLFRLIRAVLAYRSILCNA